MEVELLFGYGARHGLPTSDKLRMPLIYTQESHDE